ncbi:GNAT family N-acetyltransferase [Fulvimarina endophytica]|uniref:GNAT family N-acetyltransferase n=1 Tax=Fulvimarina endophytica TaxID=2293836 RepID=A0A371XAC1_9HYPH|nr:GNAT family N-acetyltransferase [Fulvimarina endophytica]RFC66151.1 GNAT family N-acetyltransferase [Fulvimarina endophytica]
MSEDFDAPHEEPEAEFRWSTFEELSAREIHDLLRLRSLVFVVEQTCAFAEIDGMDPQAIHLRLMIGDELAGCLRVVETHEAIRIGRIVTAKAHRGRGLGHEMMAEALRYAARRFTRRDLIVSAQSHLRSFYAAHGFEAASAPYDEDGIAHIDMTRTASREH